MSKEQKNSSLVGTAFLILLLIGALTSVFKDDDKQKETEKPASITQETTTIHQHNWKKVCGKTSVCLECGVDDGIIAQHTTDLGVCEICGLEFRKESPITIIGRTWEKDVVGGVQWKFKVRNNTDKTIKYITFQWFCYNAVGDFVYDDIDGKNYVKIKYTGPLEGGATTEYMNNTTRFYDHSFDHSEITEIKVEYMDGTIEKISNYHNNIQE